MRIFVTGASGHIASAVIPELICAGHTVVGLARSDSAAAAVRALGAQVHRGELADTSGLAAAAKHADGVIHLAFDHEQQGRGNLQGAVAADLGAIHAIGQALAGSGKPFVGTCATGGLALAGFSGLLTEDVTLPGGPRIDAENAVIALAQQGVRSSVVRLPPAVHHNGRYGFVSGLIGIARSTGVAGYLGDGSNRWPSTDTRDVAVAYRLALELATAGTRFQAVAEEGIPMREIALAIGLRLGVPAVAVTPEDAQHQFGFLTAFVGLDNPASSQMTRDMLGWVPTRPGLLESIGADPALAPGAV
ncbi:SDR family oxidoreductase [Pseudomonas antarctica]|uniref:SDR family oxidoreductase n=1 Tax=Pseudomonas antarctica TaxID=219572 RepID=UPI003F74BD3D